MPNTTLLIVLAASVVGLLGTGHLLLTFWGSRLLPRDRALQQSMQRVSPVITTQTTIWKAWMGFNASHSMGAILFGLVYGYLATTESDLLFQSPFLLAVGFLMLSGYLVLAWLYWFITPQLGMTLAWSCYLLSLYLTWL